MLNIKASLIEEWGNYPPSRGQQREGVMTYRIAMEIPDRLDLVMALLAEKPASLDLEVESETEGGSCGPRHTVKILLGKIMRHGGHKNLLIEGVPIDARFTLPVAKVQVLIEYDGCLDGHVEHRPYCYFLNDQDAMVDDPWSDKVE